MLAGTRDALSLGTVAAGLQLANPYLWSIIPEAALPMALAGGVSLGLPRANRYLESAIKNATKGVLFDSDVPPSQCFLESGYRIGATRDHRYPVDVSDDYAVRHNAIVGQSGFGKTTLITYLLAQQKARGGGYIFIDAKIDYKTLQQLYHLAKLYGREDEFYVLNVSDPFNSNSYSPIMNGDPDEKSARVMNLQPSTDNNAGADHYRQSSAHAFNVIFQALDELNYAYTFDDIVILMQSPRALLDIERELPDGNSKVALGTLLENYKRVGKDGKVELDIDRFKSTVGGMIGRLAQFANGKFGQVFNTYAPEIDLYDIMTNNKMLYVMVPTMAKDIAATNLAKMIISDLRSAAARIQELPEHLRPFPYFMFVGDEFGSYAIEYVKTLFEQARSAHIQMYPAFQSFTQLNKVSTDFTDIIIQNTYNKYFFKFGAKDSTEDAAEILGKTTEFLETLSASNSQGSSSQLLRTNPQESNTDSGGLSHGWREQETFRVTPDQIRSLDMGQCVLQHGSDVFCLDTPLVKFPKDLPNFQKCCFPTKTKTGLKPLNLAKRFKDYQTKGKEEDREEIF